MKTKKIMGLIAVGILGVAGLWGSTVHADDDGSGPAKKATVTVQSPMEIPGSVLAPGNYVFKQSGSQSGWTIVQIYNQSESTLVTTVLAYPNAKLSSNGETVMTYAAPSRTGQVLEAVVFPGDAEPDQFAYPAAEADRIGAANRVRIPSTGTNDAYPSALPDAASSWSAPLSGNVAATAPATDASNAMTAQKAPAQSADGSLPQTASSLPLFGVIGMLALVGAVALRKLGAAKS
jgi:hypothetical protein